jgi:hypothetical protein
MIVLGIESSCDETGVALYDSEKGLLGHLLHSQVKLHASYGGVVPELASRDHVRKLIPLIDVMAHLPLVKVEDDAVRRLLNGVPPQADEAELPAGCAEGDLLRLTDGIKLLAIAAYAPTRNVEKRGDFELSRVFTLGQ